MQVRSFPRERGPKPLAPDSRAFAGMNGILLCDRIPPANGCPVGLAALYSRHWRSAGEMAISKVGAPQGHVAEWLRNGLQNRVPRFNSGRGLQINRQVRSSTYRGVKPRASFSSSRDASFQHRCLQTSCWVVQLRLQVPLPAPAAGFVATAAVVGMQEFWQFIACVSQLI
jgi:hypothetical protein